MNEIDKPTYLYEGESLEIQNWNEKKEITFDELVKAVRVTSEASQASALKAINRMLTMRNWLIGYYIVEFEQKGKERIEYAKAGMDNKLFVSTYQLQLPDESTLEKFLLRQLEENQKTKTLKNVISHGGRLLRLQFA